TTVGQSNAYNAASQAALAHAAVALAVVAPEVAACGLRSQCSICFGGSVELLLRGTYDASTTHRPAVERYARGDAQGAPDMPALFGAVVADVDTATSEIVSGLWAGTDGLG